MSHDAADRPPPSAHPPFDHGGADGRDLILEAYTHLGGSLSGDGTASWKIPLARQKAGLCRWAENLDLLLSPEDLPVKALRGGQEHELFHEVGTDRYFKVTRDGVFGLTPGIELAMVSSSEDGRRFHLWEATPLDYLERLLLQNQLVPDLNRMEGIIQQSESEVAIVTSQPRFDIHSVSEAEIAEWFAAQGFQKVTHSAYYRQTDNLAIFDAHDKNVVRAGDILIPFDVIPCHPTTGFLKFIQDTLAGGHRLTVVRTVSTTTTPG
jgi:hypothetical protein